MYDVRAVSLPNISSILYNIDTGITHNTHYTLRNIKYIVRDENEVFEMFVY